jgi:hypothetical protein
MADFDDFFLDNDDLEEEASLGPIEEAKLEIMEKIEKVVKEAKRNIEFKESGDFRANFSVLSRYVGAVLDLEELISPTISDDIKAQMNISNEPLTEDQILDKIDEIMAVVKELSFIDIKEYENKQNTIVIDPYEEEEDDDDDFGF